MNWSLRRILVVPYVLLVIGLAATIGGVSYANGVHLVETILQNQLIEKVRRIGFEVHDIARLAGQVLDVAFPRDMPGPRGFYVGIPELRRRFWVATGLDIDNYANVYYGTTDGKLISVLRKSQALGDMQLVDGPGRPGRIAMFTGTLGEPGPFTASFRTAITERPWYRMALDQTGDIWTSIYIDVRTDEFVASRARRVMFDDGEPAGVVATDLSLKALNEQLLSARMTSHGMAFIMESDGMLIASTASPYLRRDRHGDAVRLSASDAGNPLVAQLAERVRTALTIQGAALPQTLTVEGLDGERIFAAFTRVVDDAGLNWVIVVAAPRKDLMHDVSHNVLQTFATTIVALCFAIVISFVIVDWVAQDLHRLAEAARKVGEGDLDTRVGVERDDEIGVVARSFENMLQRLRTDRMTRVANREAFLRRVDGEIARRRHAEPPNRFGVLFIDVNRFKHINDELGHDAGDRVLIEIAHRLAQTMRPSDLVARYAGDEFVIFVDDASDRSVLDLVRERIDKTMRVPVTLSGSTPLRCSVSIGAALFPDDGLETTRLLARADEEMYQRKAARGH